jgi:hypothetical protein
MSRSDAVATSKPRPKDEDQEWELEEPGQRIVGSEDRRPSGTSERRDVVARGELTSSHVAREGEEIPAQTFPFHARGSACLRHRLAVDELPEQMREVDPDPPPTECKPQALGLTSSSLSTRCRDRA